MLADDGERPWRLALDATRLRVRLPVGGPVELVEATAALQDLACGVLPAEPPTTAPGGPADARAAVVAELRGGAGRPRAKHPDRCKRPVPGHQSRRHSDLAGRAGRHATPGRPVPVR